MTGREISNLINLGAVDRVRNKLKRQGIGDRLATLNDCIPYVTKTKANLAFFKKHFATELGAIMEAENDLEKAEELYRKAV